MTLSPTRPRAWAILLCCAAACTPAIAGPIDQLVVFGDSLSDTGNILAITSTPFAASLGFTPRPAAPFYTHGQFTCGPDNTGPGNPVLNTTPTAYAAGVWHHTLADRLGVPWSAAAGVESIAAGTNYAFGGAESGTGSFISPGVLTQVQRYFDRPALAQDALHVFWAGSNDLLNTAQAPGATPAQVLAAGVSAVNNLSQAIEMVLSGLDPAQPARVLWANLPPLDLTPEGAALSPDLRAALAQASASFAQAQAVAADALRGAHPTLSLLTLDVHQLFLDVLAAPLASGFTNVTTPFLQLSDFSTPGPMSGTQLAPAGANPDAWLFWDDLHPTAHAHALIGEAAARLVPAPAAPVLVLAGAAGLISRRRRR